MALTNMAKVGTQGPFATMKPQGAVRLDVDFDASYSTGGYSSFVATSIKGVSGLESITVIDIPMFFIDNGTTYYICKYDRANDKLMVIDPTSGNEVAALTNLAAFTDQEFIVWFQ